MLHTQQQIIGKSKEKLACRYLEKKGFKLIEKNYYCRRGEIDLIMRDQDCLVFIEVRYRKNDRFGSALESIHFHKQKRLIFTAKQYLQQTRTPLASRFDVVAISGDEANPSINWIKNAFGT